MILSNMIGNDDRELTIPLLGTFRVYNSENERMPEGTLWNT